MTFLLDCVLKEVFGQSPFLYSIGHLILIINMIFSNMENSNRSGYVDFKTSINGIETDIKILETLTHVFIYVNQAEDQVNLFDEELKTLLVRKDIKRKKDLEIFCNLRSKDNLEDVGVFLHKIFIK